MDPELTDEYTRLLRLVRITQNLIRRYRDTPWADRISLKKQEERLHHCTKISVFRIASWNGMKGDNDSRL